MKPNALYLFLTILSLCTHTCTSCQPYAIITTPDTHGADLTTQQAHLTNTLIQGTHHHPCIHVTGTLDTNFHDEQTRVGTLIIPAGTDIKIAAEALRNTTQPQNVPTITPLLGNTGFAYYQNAVAPATCGNMQVDSFSGETLLTPNQDYTAYMFLRRTNTQCVYYSPTGITFQVPANNPYPTLKLQQADLTQAHTGTLELTLEATKTYTTPPPPTGLDAQGFILLKQGNTTLTPTSLAHKLLQDPQSLTTTHTLAPWTQNPDVIYVTTTNTSPDHITVQDTQQLLQTGVDYDVYAYGMVQNAGKTTLILSDNHETIQVRKAYAQMQMQQIQVQDLRHVAPKADLNTVTLDLAGTIAKEENLLNPTLGFFITPDQLTQEIARQQISTQLASATTTRPAFDIAAGTATVVACAAGTAGPNTYLTNFSKTVRITGQDLPIAAMLGKECYAHCWLMENSQVFSSGAMNLYLPKVALEVNQVTSKQGAKELEITLEVAEHDDPKANVLDPAAKRGFIFLDQLSTPQQDLDPNLIGALRHFINYSVVVDPNSSGYVTYLKRYGNAHAFTGGCGPGLCSSSTAQSFHLQDHIYTYFSQQGSQYAVYYWLQHNPYLFISEAGKDSLVIPEQLAKRVSQRVVLKDNRSFQVYVDTHEVMQVAPDGSHNPVLNTTADQETLLREVLGHVFKVNGQPNDQEITDFIAYIPIAP